MADFVHLHTTYSLLDGQCQIVPLVKKARRLGMPAPEKGGSGKSKMSGESGRAGVVCSGRKWRRTRWRLLGRRLTGGSGKRPARLSVSGRATVDSRCSACHS